MNSLNLFWLQQRTDAFLDKKPATTPRTATTTTSGTPSNGGTPRSHQSFELVKSLEDKIRSLETMLQEAKSELSTSEAENKRLREILEKDGGDYGSAHVHSDRKRTAAEEQKRHPDHRDHDQDPDDCNHDHDDDPHHHHDYDDHDHDSQRASAEKDSGFGAAAGVAGCKRERMLRTQSDLSHYARFRPRTRRLLEIEEESELEMGGELEGGRERERRRMRT
eukprot:CAMPEP_0167817298 /NCGR_PEP_ID=MMETSP0112_2-20121227/4104_1 /TAXON_ID=91324 /ORGANISM="Lotharella globosa, Strain CCCM811" /LENGTH=220 /DNA_ID=CAMNT_0007717021 /DNA_START=137 /DNA_END=796 /DNA_ORIENTATION=-